MRASDAHRLRYDGLGHLRDEVESIGHDAAPIRQGAGKGAPDTEPSVTGPPSVPWRHLADGHDGFERIGSTAARAENIFDVLQLERSRAGPRIRGRGPANSEGCRRALVSDPDSRKLEKANRKPRAGPGTRRTLPDTAFAIKLAARTARAQPELDRQRAGSEVGPRVGPARPRPRIRMLSRARAHSGWQQPAALPHPSWPRWKPPVGWRASAGPQNPARAHTAQWRSAAIARPRPRRP